MKQFHFPANGKGGILLVITFFALNFKSTYSQGIFSNTFSETTGSVVFNNGANLSSLFLNPSGTSLIKHPQFYISYTKPYSVKNLQLSNILILSPLGFGAYSFGFATLNHPLYNKTEFCENLSFRLSGMFIFGFSLFQEQEKFIGYRNIRRFYASTGLCIPVSSVVFGIFHRCGFDSGNGDEKRSTGLTLSYSSSVLDLGIEIIKEQNFSLTERFCGIFRPLKHFSFLFGITKAPQSFSVGTDFDINMFSFHYVHKIHNTLLPANILGISVHFKNRNRVR